MPFTTPLADLPVSWPSADAQIVDPSQKQTPEFRRWMDQLRRYLATVDGAIEEGGTQVTTVGALPSATGKQGVRYMVTDANATTFMSTLAAGGANVVPVVSDGTNWKIG